MEKMDRKNMKLVWRDDLISLYCVSVDTTKRPLFHMNGQMEHHIQAIETATKATEGSCYQYSMYWNMYPEFTQYIAVFDYKIFRNDKQNINTTNFSLSVMRAIEELALEDVVFTGQSVGAMVGMRSAISDRVSQVIAIHPPILSSPLVNAELLKEKKDLLSKKQNLIRLFLANKFFFNPAFGFQQENKNGYVGLDDNKIHDKSLIVGSAIDQTHKDKFAAGLSALIYNTTGLQSDGVVVWEPKKLIENGFSIAEDESPMSHFQMASSTEYTDTVLKNYIKR